MKWKEIAMRIAEDVYAECGNDEEKVLKLIDFISDNCNKVMIDIDKAYETVWDARKNNYDIFEEANLLLVEVGGYKISFDEDIDDVIQRLARLIIREKAVDYYIQLEEEVKERIKD